MIARAIFALALCIAWTAAASAAPPRDPRAIPLIDQLGRTFTISDLHHPTAIIFIATHCADACPIAESMFSGLERSLAHDHIDARLLTITLEPREDPPAAMAAAARAIGADPNRWRWASGRPSDVNSLLDAFGVYRAGASYHSTFVYVLDSQGRLMRTLMLSSSSARTLHDLLRRAVAT